MIQPAVASADPITGASAARTGETATSARHRSQSIAFADLLLGEIAALPAKSTPRDIDAADRRPPSKARRDDAPVRSFEAHDERDGRAASDPQELPANEPRATGEEDSPFPPAEGDGDPAAIAFANEPAGTPGPTEAAEAPRAPTVGETSAPPAAAAEATRETGSGSESGSAAGEAGLAGLLGQSAPSFAAAAPAAAGTDLPASARPTDTAAPAAVRPHPEVAAPAPSSHATSATAEPAIGLSTTANSATTATGPEGGAVAIVKQQPSLISQPSSTLAPQAVAAIAPPVAAGKDRPSAAPAAATTPGKTGVPPANTSVVAPATAPTATPAATVAGAAASPQASPAATTAELGTVSSGGSRPAMPAAGIGAADGLPGSQVRFANQVQEKTAPATEARRPALTDQVSVHITKALRDGTDRIDIQLKPASLGRVDVRLELSPDGRVHASITAESRHAFDLLRGDARDLERALQDAGFKADSGSLSFNLRGQDERQARGESGASPAGRAVAAGDEAGEEQTDYEVSPRARGGLAVGRLDIHA
jgi:flagellar hook-length control protein FliK